MSQSNDRPPSPPLTRRSLFATAAAVTSTLWVNKGCTAPETGDGVLDVAILGGGLSGLVAARQLRRSGVESLAVLEARDRVGGRTLNQEIGDGYVVEAGGQWVGPTQTAVLELAAELGVGTFATYDRGDVVYLVGGESMRIGGGGEPATGPTSIAGRIDALAETVPLARPWEAERAAEWDAMSFGDWLDQEGVSAEERLGIDLGSSLTFGALPDQLSLLWVLFYVHSAGGWSDLESIEGGAQQDRIVGGSQILSLELAAALGDRVRLATPVVAVRGWDGGDAAIEIDTAAGETLHARRVVVAMMPSLAEAIRFEPALSGERAGLQREWPTYGTGMKVHVKYGEPFWRADGLNGQSIADSGPVLWTTDNSPPDAGVGVIMAFVDSALLPSTQEARGEVLAAELAKRFGEAAAKPLGYFEMDWAKERYTRGCVSPLAPGFLTRFGTSLRPQQGHLFWAGTETAEIWNGYMDGAVRAGRKVAESVAASLAAATAQAG